MKNKGFTLAELLGVIVVMAIIIGMALSTYVVTAKNLKQKTYESKKQAIAIAAIKYATDANINGAIKITATKLIIDNYYEAEEYVDNKPFIANPIDANDNLACHIINISLDNHEYFAEVEDESDCTTSSNEIDNSKINIVAYKMNGNTLENSLYISNDNSIQWTNKNVLLSVTSDEDYKSVSYTMAGDTITKNKNVKNVGQGSTITNSDINTYSNLYKVEALLLLNQNITVTLQKADGNSIEKTITVRIDKEPPIIVEDPDSDSLASERKASVIVSDGAGSGVYRGYYSRTVPINQSKNIYEIENNKIIIEDIKKNGTYTITVTDYAGNESLPYNLTTTKIESVKYNLILKGRLDGASKGSLNPFGTADIYINGVLKANDVSRYDEIHEYGDTYEIKDIKNNYGYTYSGKTSYSGQLRYLRTEENVYLPFNSNYYTLTYNSTGGTSCSSLSQKYGKTWRTLCSPTRDGYTFEGWYTGTNGSGTRIEASTVVTGNTNVYAKWQ